MDFFNHVQSSVFQNVCWWNQMPLDRAELAVASLHLRASFAAEVNVKSPTFSAPNRSHLSAVEGWGTPKAAPKLGNRPWDHGSWTTSASFSKHGSRGSPSAMCWELDPQVSTWAWVKRSNAEEKNSWLEIPSKISWCSNFFKQSSLISILEVLFNILKLFFCTSGEPMATWPSSHPLEQPQLPRTQRDLGPGQGPPKKIEKMSKKCLHFLDLRFPYIGFLCSLQNLETPLSLVLKLGQSLVSPVLISTHRPRFEPKDVGSRQLKHLSACHPQLPEMRSAVAKAHRFRPLSSQTHPSGGRSGWILQAVQNEIPNCNCHLTFQTCLWLQKNSWGLLFPQLGGYQNITVLCFGGCHACRLPPGRATSWEVRKM